MKKNFFIFLFLGMSLLCFYPLSPSYIKERGLWGMCFFLMTCGLYFFSRQTRKKKPQSQWPALFTSLPDAILLLDFKGTILQITDQAKEILGVQVKKWEGLHLFDTQLELPLLKECHNLFKHTLATGRFQETILPLDKDKKRLYLLRITPLTALDSVILQFKEHTNNLERQVGRDFVANASHELRTPITIIKGFAETLLDLPQISDNMFQDFMDKIVRSCQRMDTLVKNLLTLADLDYLSQARLQECDLVMLADNCIYTLLALHPHTNIEILHNEEVIMIVADPDLLELAIMNLLENAVKYSPILRKITVTIEKYANYVHLTIADQGKGIPKQDLSHIFERFYTVDKARSRKLGGAGLGLSIVKTIVEKHHASIEVFSKIDEGSQFVITFKSC